MTQFATARRLALGLAAALAASAAQADPARFETPQAAVDAFVEALDARDHAALLAVFGAESEDLMSSGNPGDDAEARDEFLDAYRQHHELVALDEGRLELEVGPMLWPFPVTLVSADGGWHFDPASARDEILARRIGLNELDVIELLQRAVVVMSDFRTIDHDGDGVMEYAASILSTPGQHDGLYWPSAEGEPESPIGAFVAQAAADGISLDGVDQPPEPYLGYYYRILTRQGAAAPGGAYDYVINGNMVAGFAMLAYPAAPGETGVMSFLVGENGVIYQADLGENTVDLAGAIDSFDPAAPWQVMPDQP